MSTRLNLLLIFMLMLLSVSVVAPYALRHREQMISDGRLVRSEMTSFAQRVFGGDGTAKTDNDEADLSQIHQLIDGMGGNINKAMTDNAREITHMLEAKGLELRDRMADGMAADKKAFDKNIAVAAQDFPEIASFAKNITSHIADAGSLVTRQFADAQPTPDTVKSKPGNIHKVARTAVVDNGDKNDKNAPFDITKLLTAPSEMLKSQFQTIFHSNPGANQADVES